MASEKFVMISNCFSDGILLKKEGPELKREFFSELAFEGGKSCISVANFVPKWRAKCFVTTLTVGEDLRYFESVLLGRETVLTNYSESISVFSKDKVQNYRSELFYEPDATNKRFVTGIELWPAQKSVSIPHEEDDVMSKGDATERVEKHVNGDIQGCTLINVVA